MNNLLNKMQILQLILILSFIIISNLSFNHKLINNNSINNDFFSKLIKYNEIIKEDFDLKKLNK